MKFLLSIFLVQLALALTEAGTLPQVVVNKTVAAQPLGDTAFKVYQAAATSYSYGTSISSVCGGVLVANSLNFGSDYLRYDNVDFGAGAEAVDIYFSDGNAFGYTGVVIFRTGSSSGPIIGQTTVSTTGSWCDFKVIRTILTNPPKGVQTLYITFDYNQYYTTEILYLRTFEFQSTIW